MSAALVPCLAEGHDGRWYITCSCGLVSQCFASLAEARVYLGVHTVDCTGD